MTRLIRNRAAKIRSPQFLDAAEAPVAATGNPPVVVKDGAGATVVSTTAAPVSGQTGVYELALTPAQVAILDTYDVIWSPVIAGVTQTYYSHFEVVGGFVFSIQDVVRNLEGMVEVSTTSLLETRSRVEEMLEKRLGFSPVPRSRRAVLSGRAANWLAVADWFIHEVYSVSIVDGAVITAYSASALADLEFGSKQVFRKDGTVFPWGNRNVQVHYAYGMQEAPEPIRRAGLLMTQAQFMLTDSEGNPTRPLSSVLFDIPEVAELLADWTPKGAVYSLQVGTS
jgi:hypothetical protein